MKIIIGFIIHLEIIFYYSIVDIIDSLPESSFGGLDFNRDIKKFTFSLY